MHCARRRNVEMGLVARNQMAKVGGIDNKNRGPFDLITPEAGILVSEASREGGSAPSLAINFARARCRCLLLFPKHSAAPGCRGSESGSVRRTGRAGLETREA